MIWLCSAKIVSVAVIVAVGVNGNGWREILGLDVVGVVPESTDVLSASNAGTPVILNEGSDVSAAYKDAVARLLGESVPLRFIDEPKRGFFARLFGG